MATLQNIGIEKVTAKALADAKGGKLSLKDLVGKWHACDKNTRGIVRIVLGTKGSALTVQVFGSCTPTPCDWGVVEGTAYADDVSSTEAIAFTARYDPGFKESIVTGQLDNGTLIVDVFSKFTDGSGRSNYHDRSYLCRG